MTPRLSALACACMMLLGSSIPSVAQEPVQSSAMRVNLSGYMHIQFNTTSVDAEHASEFKFRRSRLTFDATVTEMVRLRWMIDFTEFDEVSLRDAYANIAFSRAFRVTLGQFKRPFDLFILQSSNRISVIERKGEIRGVDDCNLGGVCSYNRLLAGLQYAQRDLGFMIDGSTLTGGTVYFFSVTNGTGLNQPSDVNSSKSFTGRIGLRNRSKVRIGANVGLHDYINDTTGNQNAYAAAAGIDVEVGRYHREGFHFLGSGAVGGNWVELDAAGNTSTFLGWMGLVSYFKPVTVKERAMGIEPMARVSWSNPGVGDFPARWLVTPGAFFYFLRNTKVAINVDWYLPNDAPNEWSFIIQAYFDF